MKKIIYITLLILVSNAIYAEVGWYKFSEEGLLSDYKQYVGKTVLYVPYNDKKFIQRNRDYYNINTQKFISDTEYIITNISFEYKTRNYLTSKYATISFREKYGKNKIKATAKVSVAGRLPFFFIDDFNADKPDIIGKTFSDPLVRGEYKIIDAKLEETPDSLLEKGIVYSVSNEEINRSFKTPNLEKVEGYLAEDKSGNTYATLVKVEKPENPSDRYGEVKTIEEDSLTKYSFEDEIINIKIFCNILKFHFLLTNKSQNSIKIVWDDAVVVDNSGMTSKVIHSGVKYSQRDAPQTASTIIRGASLNDTAVPSSNIRYSDDLKDWTIDPMSSLGPEKEIRQIQLMLPIQIKDVVNEYIFVFEVIYKYNHPERLKFD